MVRKGWVFQVGKRLKRAAQGAGGGAPSLWGVEFFSHENVKHPPSISKDGTLYHGKKSDLVQELIDTCQNSVIAEYPNVDGIILNGPAIVHMAKPNNDCTIEEY